MMALLMNHLNTQVIDVTFKNVGAGDSLVLEWQHNGCPKIAVIDCNLHNGSNPVLDHIINGGYNEVDFILLSHPHFDHYSGMINLIEKLIDKGINLKNFAYTATDTISDWKASLKTIEAHTNLTRLLKLVHSLNSSGHLSLGSVHAGSITNTVKLSSNIQLEVLSPSAIEYAKYRSGKTFPVNEESHHNEPLGNWLATVLKIDIVGVGYVLLTSDCDKSTLTRLDGRARELFQKGLVLGQCPHHGSKSNLNRTFWKKRLGAVNTPIAISADGNKYGHPNKEVINFYLSNGYDVHCTFDLNNRLSSKASKAAAALSSFASPTGFVTKKDLTFTF